MFEYLISLKQRCAQQFIPVAKHCFYLIGKRLVELAKFSARVLKRLVAWLSRFSRLIGRYLVRAFKFSFRVSRQIAVWVRHCFYLIGKRLVELAKFSTRVLKRLVAWLSRFSRLIGRYLVRAFKFSFRVSRQIAVWVRHCFYLIGKRLVELAKFSTRVLKRLVAWLSRFSRLIGRYLVRAFKFSFRVSRQIAVWVRHCFYLIGKRLVELAKFSARVLKRLVAWLGQLGSMLSVAIKTKWFVVRDRLNQYYYLTRLDKPIGIFLLLWPVLWALWMAAEGTPDLSILLVFIAGVVLMRSAGCVINDLADRNFDRQVKRTSNRPITSGKVKPVEATALGITLLVSAGLLALSLNPLTLKLSFVAVALALIYPFMKRYTYLPQVFLGLAFGWGIPMAFAAQTNGIPQAAWLIFIAVVLWAMVYDTMYAMVDREDDIKIGIKSTAILFDDADRLFIAVMQIMVLLALTLAGAKLALGRYYFAGLGIAAVLFLYQQFLIKDRIKENCFRGFMNNNWFGATVFAGVYFHYVIG